MEMDKMFSTAGMKVIVTGGASGMGLASARLFGQGKAEVGLIDVSAQTGQIAGMLQQETGAVYHPVAADLADSTARKNAFATAVELLGGAVDVLVNCAGIQHTCDSVDFPAEAWQRVLEVNLNALWDLSQMAGRVMLKQGAGTIINFASMLSFIGGFRVPAYAASKGAVAQLTKALSNEWAGQGVRVNAVAPGYIMTPLNNGFAESERGKWIKSRIPANRWGEPEEIAAVVYFLATPAAGYMSGAVVAVDGGFSGS